MIEVAAACVRHSASKRPRMGQVNIGYCKKRQKKCSFGLQQQANAQTTDMVFLNCCVSQVVRAFDSLRGSDLTNGMQLGESEVFDSAQQSEEIRLFRRMAFGSQNYSTEFFSRASVNL